MKQNIKLIWDRKNDRQKNIQPPNYENTEYGGGRGRYRLMERCDQCKNNEHDACVIITIKRNGMVNCRCMHRFNLTVCDCHTCYGGFDQKKPDPIKIMLEYLDVDKLLEK